MSEARLSAAVAVAVGAGGLVGVGGTGVYVGGKEVAVDVGSGVEVEAGVSAAAEGGVGESVGLGTRVGVASCDVPVGVAGGGTGVGVEGGKVATGVAVLTDGDEGTLVEVTTARRQAASQDASAPRTRPTKVRRETEGTEPDPSRER